MEADIRPAGSMCSQKDEGTIRVAACQILTTGDVEKSTDKILQELNACAESNIDIVAFPEGALFGYNCDEDYWSGNDPEIFLRAEERIGKALARLGVAAVVGSAHVEDGEWKNSLAIFDKDGILKARYSKTFLAGERWCTNNKGPLPVVRLAGVYCSFVICHDIRYPELVRLPTIQGAKLCFFCSNESNLTQQHKLSAYRAMPVSRATENGIYLVMANAPADPEDLASSGSSHGNSKIVHPDGRILSESGFFSEEIIQEKIDLEVVKNRLADRVCSDDTVLKDWISMGRSLVRVID